MRSRVSDVNPWVRASETAQPLAEELRALASPPLRAVTEPRRVKPQPGIESPERADRLPRRQLDAGTAASVRLWWLGVHGGAGESTLEQLLENSRAAGHAWPVSGPGTATLPRVALVARTNANGLKAAQLAATEWAGETVRADLLGLVLIADVPGRLPRALRELAELVAGGVPRVWHLPWVEGWRQGQDASAHRGPRGLRVLLSELDGLLDVEEPLTEPIGDAYVASG
ncbi:MAG: hypothetical protein H0X28_05065 [Solirubrobacterales bacterium]|nr:hypothetical protein [Solirubrobacterales bacterium]